MTAGRIGRSFRRAKRYQEDKEYRAKIDTNSKKYGEIHKEERAQRFKERTRILNEFANKKCKVCGKPLSHRTMSGLCLLHAQRKRRANKK